MADLPTPATRARYLDHVVDEHGGAVVEEIGSGRYVVEVTRARPTGRRYTGEEDVR